MIIFKIVLAAIGIAIGLIVLTVLVAFLMELVKAFAQSGKKDNKDQ